MIMSMTEQSIFHGAVEGPRLRPRLKRIFSCSVFACCCFCLLFLSFLLFFFLLFVFFLYFLYFVFCFVSTQFRALWHFRAIKESLLFVACEYCSGVMGVSYSGRVLWLLASLRIDLFACLSCLFYSLIYTV